MNINPTYHGATGVDSKQRKITTLLSVLGAKGNKSDRAESKAPIKTRTRTRKRIFPARPTRF